jgi:hypothetical protein
MHDPEMKPFPALTLAAASALCMVLAGCARDVEPTTSAVVRSRAPVGYASQIKSYFGFKIPGSAKNAEITVGKPEPGGCPLDGHITSRRGWVVPVVYATRSGAPTGKEIITITTRQYYFWFLEETIAGVTPRMEVCP